MEPPGTPVPVDDPEASDNGRRYLLHSHHAVTSSVRTWFLNYTSFYSLSREAECISGAAARGGDLDQEGQEEEERPLGRGGAAQRVLLL